MSETVIKVEGVSKQYRLGNIGTGTFSHDLNRWWHTVRGKEDPYLKIGEVNDRRKKGGSDYVWALKDIAFEVKQGEVMGIIGKNGAGKSTLLKILSRTTLPTAGSIKIKGRVASLLEVGTGFHPELTGQENIYLNGAILGMRKWEIKKKFDEMVDFSGVEKYIDTPVKRYSSGMYVRLAFAVAAYLEPEILIVDEVLAVGDAEFQKKALGKMKNISKGEGRTVLFVSHNMAAIQNLCNSGILLMNGGVEFHGQIDDVVTSYLSNSSLKYDFDYLNSVNRKGNGLLKITNIFLSQNDLININKIESLNQLIFNIDYQFSSKASIRTSRIDIGINDIHGTRVGWFSTWNKDCQINKNKRRIIFKIENFNLSPGEYTCNVFCEVNGEVTDWLENILPFTVIEKDYYRTGKIIPRNQGGLLFNYEILND